MVLNLMAVVVGVGVAVAMARRARLKHLRAKQAPWVNVSRFHDGRP